MGASLGVQQDGWPLGRGAGHLEWAVSSVQCVCSACTMQCVHYAVRAVSLTRLMVPDARSSLGGGK